MSTLSTASRLAHLLTAGGVLFALGNALHPLHHGDAAEQTPTWLLSHALFAAGAVLVCAGVPGLQPALRRTLLGRAGVVLTWLAMLLVPVGAWYEIFAAPQLSDALAAEVDGAAAPFTAVQTALFILGPVLLGVGGLRARAWGRLVSVALFTGPALLLLLPALPGPDGIWVIVGTVLLGSGLAGAGLAVGRLTGTSPQIAPQDREAAAGSGRRRTGHRTETAH
jgi:hypothetical protein